MSEQIRTEQLRGIDLFSGCGGMSLGFEEAGIDVLCAFDHWKPAIDVYRENFRHPIVDFDLSDTDSAVRRIKPFQPDIIFGGPPCQDFSTAGKMDETRGRARLTSCFANIVTRVRPTWFVMENVPSITSSHVFKEILGSFREAGYGVSHAVLNAMWFDVPEHRRRMLIVGRMGETDRFLDDVLTRKENDEPMTVRRYFKEINEALDVDDYFSVATNYNRRHVFSVDEPSPTIRGMNRPVPPGYKGNKNDTAPYWEVRPLTTRERAIIQTFPPDFILKGTRTAQEQMIGNAVPVNLARHVASVIIEYETKHNQS